MNRRQALLRWATVGLILVVLAAEAGWFVLGWPAHPSTGFAIELDILRGVAVPYLILLGAIGIFGCASLLSEGATEPLTVRIWAVGEAVAGTFFFYMSSPGPDSDTAVLRATAPLLGIVAFLGAGGAAWLLRVTSARP